MKLPESFTTEKGTVLPLLNLKGKIYLQVAHRILWFREKYPNGLLKTALVEHGHTKQDIPFAVFRAEVFITNEKGELVFVSSAHQMETKEGFADYLAKAETSALGRALAEAGIGTQFCIQDMDEGTKLSDAPIGTPTQKESFTNIPKEKSMTGSSDVKDEKAFEEAIKSDPPAEEEKPSFKTQRRKRAGLKDKPDDF